MLTVEEYLRRISGKDRDKELVTSQDHNYVKHWNAHSESHRIRPARNLFMHAIQKQKYPIYPEEEIDVVTPDISYLSPFDNSRSKILSNELNYYSPDIDDNGDEVEDYESLVENHPHQERRIFLEVMDIVKSEILAKLTFSQQSNECLKLKLASEIAAKQLRLLFAELFWDFELILWNHSFILEKCDVITISTYINLLQALRAKVPSLVDKVLNHDAHKFESSSQLSQLLKKENDPILPVLSQHKPKKLPGNPFMLISTGFSLNRDECPRLSFWKNYFSSLCRNTHSVHFPLNSDGGHSPVLRKFEDTLDASIASFQKKIIEFKNHYPNRPVIIAGWTIGALLACYVALKTTVDAVICIGFPLTGVNGSRGDMNDILLENTVPTLFIVGQNSNMCSIDDIEDFRSRMKAETGLITVGGADDMLRISPQKLMKEGITQEVADRCILDDIGDFLQTILSKLPSSSSSSHMAYNQMKVFPTIVEENANVNIEDDGKRKRRRPREYSPELPSRKRGKYAAQKEEVPNISVKARLSPCTSETSSSSSSKLEKYKRTKSGKRNKDKRAVGRPPRSGSRKKSPSKPVAKSASEHLRNPTPKKSYKAEISRLIASVPPEPESILTPKAPKLSFALNILPKKNDPVDVENAFGKDISFLPQPLTPPEPEDTVSAEETEKALAELESHSAMPKTAENMDASSKPVSEIIPVSEKSAMPLPESLTTTVLSPKPAAGSIIKPVISSPDAKKSIAITVAPAGFKTVFQQSKILNSGSASQVKNISSVKLFGTNVSSNAANTTKTVVTVPSSSATILVSGATIKTKSGKVLQLLSKGPISVKGKEITPSVVSNVSQSVTHGNASEQQSCNLSLLSDVAGMTEHLKDAKKSEHNTSATLVKLAVPDKPQPQQIKRLQYFARPASSRVETPEEMVEKQLAIQALNKSIGIESSTPQTKESRYSISAPQAREASYSICYPKTVMSRPVPQLRPATQIVRQSVLSHPGRGRPRPIMPNRNYRFYQP